ncbi:MULTISPECIES: phosphoglucosamine mutase [Brevibacterium]|jgi:phosphoglucosamine mutase|uniref:Phosphoglucosamine mutase n=3 Tax=Brevibacterium TaxID=1696 RepID=A0A0B9A0Y5_BRELN|nr:MULTISPECIES: phosphoglucosamine mutase [Brevibacterium]KHS52452.1 phosphoglucosamine mutase [Brevibacterium linens]HHX46920.1 phosphoglucosamine mutase [Brevibacterium sp.]HJE78280.1 phosphoglucosamine mutase [Brevibacterium epidermidis]
MSRLFGTDGVRGLANRDITAKLALQLSVAGSRVLARDWKGEKRPFAVVGRDTRVSGEFLSAALSAGIASTGVDVLDAGMLPTPGIAQVVKDTGAAFGVVISASHNPMPDNGIKFFAAGGTKLDDAVEDEILEIFDQDWDRPTGSAVGRISRYPAAADEYTEHLVRCVDAENVRPLSGLKVVVDCAHGAASIVGPAALRQAGAEVIVSAAEPDGFNINDGVGSTHLEPLQRLVVETQSDLGVAFDGDADRCLAVDSLGRVVNGDQVMGILAIGLKELGELRGNTLVTTVMSNLGLTQAMEKYGIKTVQTAVGDRYVLERMIADGYALGGEQSGHVLMLDHGTTGDGVQTALHLMKRMADAKRTLADLAAEIPQLPQALVNVKGVDKNNVDHPQVAAEVAAVEAELADTGRVLLRASGTEPLIRVMVEAATEDAATAQAERLAASVKEHLAL